MNPYLSTPEAAAFWREQRKACEEARRLLVKTPEFASFLAAGGTLAVVPMGSPSGKQFTALLKDGDSIIFSVHIFADELRAWAVHWYAIEHLSQLTAWLTEARNATVTPPAQSTVL